MRYFLAVWLAACGVESKRVVWTQDMAPPPVEIVEPNDDEGAVASFSEPAVDEEPGEVFGDDDEIVPARLAATAAPAAPARTCTNVDFAFDVGSDAVAQAAMNEVATCETNDGEGGDCSSSQHVQCGYGDAEKYLGAGTPCGHRQWCTAFVSWVYRKAGEPFDRGPWSCGGSWLHVCGSYSCNGGNPSGTLQGWFKERKTWARFLAGSTLTPSPGDFVRYQWKSGSGHSGVVLRVDGDTLYTIEGNVHDGGLDCPGASEQGVAVCRIDHWRQFVATSEKSGIYGFGMRRGSGRSLSRRYAVSASSNTSLAAQALDADLSRGWIPATSDSTRRLQLDSTVGSVTARRVQLVLPCEGFPTSARVSHEVFPFIYEADADVRLVAPASCNGTFTRSVYLGRGDDTGPYGKRTWATKLRIELGSRGVVRDVRVLD